MTPFIVGLSTPPPFLMFLTNNYDHTNCNTQFTICFKRSANRLSSQTVMSKFAIAQTVQPVRLDVISFGQDFLVGEEHQGRNDEQCAWVVERRLSPSLKRYNR
jgi:hypothetical protein